MSSIEQQAAVVDQYIITDDEKEQAALDVVGESQAKWNSARLSLRLQAETEGELSKTACRLAVANRYDCKPETIRRREPVAKLVPASLLEVYDLSWSYWKTAADARHLPDKDHPDPFASMLDIIYQVNEYRTAYGQRPSVALVERWVYGEDEVDYLWRSRLESVVEKLEFIQSDRLLADPDGRAFIGWVRSLVMQYLETGISPLLETKSPSK